MRTKTTLLKLSLASVLGVALLAGACAEQGTAPEQLTATEQPAFSRGGNKKVRRLDVSNAAPMHVSTDVGPRGAILQADQYFLMIPAGAVKETTKFTMDVGTDGVVSLTATVTRANGTKVDVGANGFQKKLLLALYYGGATQRVATTSALEVGWVQNNGGHVSVPSRAVPELNLVYGELRHFSAYAIVIPSDDDE